ncbi:MAG: tRNA-guanine transglycosylase DpdA [Candidatus Poribacteria bacterium]|nr:tRNA-guanine transglycosylase DpdA [Candidatus Poribacteria bacterium]
MIKIISAKYEIIDATTLIEPYDERLDKESAQKMRPKVMQSLKEVGLPASVFINLGKDYRPAISCITTLFGADKIIDPEGGIGKKQQAMKKWLHDLPNDPAAIPVQGANRHSCLYFFPDWDDRVYDPFHADETPEVRRSKEVEKRYAHEIFGEKVPYDGMLLSLAQLRNGKGLLNRLHKQQEPFVLRDELRMPRGMPLFGDCGAFSYVTDHNPHFKPREAASLYHQFGFNLGASVDHIPHPSMSIGEKERRMKLTASYANEFLDICNYHGYLFKPIGSIQGITAEHYAHYVQEYVDMGYKHIALGGLVRRKDSEILEIVAAVREALQRCTRGKDENIWIHLFGILRPEIQSSFQNLGVSSFDSASYLRKAWMSSDRNYLAPDGKGWYGTIRVPISTSKAMRDAAQTHSISNERLEELESQCLSSLENFDGTPKSKKEVLANIDKYGPLLQRKGEGNHFVDEHKALIQGQPWKKCRCTICKELGIQVVVFRGANRNRRRGFHNTWVFYHKILNKRRKKSSKT